MEFLIPATETFIDLNRSSFENEVKIQTSTPANLAYSTVMYPVTNLAHIMIKQLSAHVNGVLLEPQTDHYHYKVFFESILNNNRNDGQTILQPQGGHNDFDLPALLTANAVDSTNLAYKELTASQQRGVAAIKGAVYNLTGGHVPYDILHPQLTSVLYRQVVDAHARRVHQDVLQRPIRLHGESSRH